MENNKMTLKIDLGRTGLDAGDAFVEVAELMRAMAKQMYSEDDKSILKDGVTSNGRYYFSEV